MLLFRLEFLINNTETGVLLRRQIFSTNRILLLRGFTRTVKALSCSGSFPEDVHFSERARVTTSRSGRESASALLLSDPSFTETGDGPDGPPKNPIRLTVVIARRCHLSRRRRLHAVRLPSHRGVYLPPDCLGSVLAVRAPERPLDVKTLGEKRTKRSKQIQQRPRDDDPYRNVLATRRVEEETFSCVGCLSFVRLTDAF